MEVIALSGWRRSGKDTVGNYLVNQYGFIRLSFADRLKEMVAVQYQIPLQDMHDPSRKEMPLNQYPVIPGDKFCESIHELLQSELKSGYWTPRALCILEGSTKRSVYANYWVRSVLMTTLANTNPDAKYVITDMRYRSEADTIKVLLPDVRLVRIGRWDSIDTQDPSERDLDDYEFKYKISNKGTMDELYDTVDTLLGDIAAGQKSSS